MHNIIIKKNKGDEKMKNMEKLRKVTALSLMGAFILSSLFGNLFVSNSIKANPSGGSLSGVAFLDNNRDGVFDSGDDILPNVQVQLTNEDGSLVSDIDPVVSNELGYFSLDNIPPGKYTIEVLNPGYPDNDSSYPLRFTQNDIGSHLYDSDFTPDANHTKATLTLTLGSNSVDTLGVGFIEPFIVSFIPGEHGSSSNNQNLKRWSGEIVGEGFTESITPSSGYEFLGLIRDGQETVQTVEEVKNFLVEGDVSFKAIFKESDKGSEVQKPIPKLTFNEPSISKTYGDQNFTIQATGVSGDIKYMIISGQEFANLQGNKVNILGAGTVGIKATYQDQEAIMTVEIAKKQLLAKAEDQTTLEGKSLKEPKIKVEGFVYGENTETAEGYQSPIGTPTANEKSPSGVYEIKVENGKAKNYEFQYISGTLKVAPGLRLMTMDGDKTSQAMKSTGDIKATHSVAIESNAKDSAFNWKPLLMVGLMCLSLAGLAFLLIKSKKAKNKE